MKSYPIVNTAEFRSNVKELERFIDSLPKYQTEVDMKFLRLEEMDYIFEKSWKYDYHCAISIVNCDMTIRSMEDELLKRITEYKFDSKYLESGNIILVFTRFDSTSIYYLDMLNIGRWVAEYNTIPGDDCDPYIKLIYRNYTEITKNNENILSLKSVVEFLKKYVEDLKDDGKGE